MYSSSRPTLNKEGQEMVRRAQEAEREQQRNRRTRTIRCNSCEGSGYGLEMGSENCSTCCGSGRDLTSDLYLSPCRADNCKGGKVSYCRRTRRPGNKCRDCNGRGSLEVDY
jgi:DnaJ-class molecular chaperone